MGRSYDPTKHDLNKTEIGRQGVTIKVRKRNCMCCHKPFLSEGNHNRLCLNCRHPDHGLDDI